MREEVGYGNAQHPKGGNSLFYAYSFFSSLFNGGLATHQQQQHQQQPTSPQHQHNSLSNNTFNNNAAFREDVAAKTCQSIIVADTVHSLQLNRPSNQNESPSQRTGLKIFIQGVAKPLFFVLLFDI